MSKTTPKPVSDYMRELQRKATKSRWSKLTKEERSAAMSTVRKGSKPRDTT